MIREHFEVSQTAVTIISDNEYINIAKDAVFDARQQIELKIAEDPFFGTTYEPYAASGNDGIVVKRMCGASLKADVGPMAAVAGAVSEYVVEKMKKAGAEHAVVDNGGDIALICSAEIRIGLNINLNGKGLSLRIPPTDDIVGVCSSSGSVGPSVSFGKSEISTVISKDAALADACATALGNLIKDGEKMIGALEKICGIDGVAGCLAFCDNSFAMCGDVPELISSENDNGLITKVLF